MAAIRLALAGAAWSREFEEGDEREARDERGAPQSGERGRGVPGRAGWMDAREREIQLEARGLEGAPAVESPAAAGADAAGLPRASRERIEALLRAKKLDGTLTGGAREDEAARAAWVARLVPTGWAELDARLGGGFPRGECSEIVGARSTGRTSVLCALLAGAAARGEIVALVDACDRFDPVSAAGFGLDLDRLLWVRGVSPEPCARDAGTEAGEPSPAAAGEWRARMDERSREGMPAPARAAGAGRRRFTATAAAREEAERQARQLDRAIKAFGLILQAGGFGLVALDVADVPAMALRRLPFTTWRRLQRLLEGSDTVGVLLAAEPLGRSARGVTLRLSAAEGGRHLLWTGTGEHGRLFTGFAFQPQVHSARRLGDTLRPASTGAMAGLRHTGTRG